MLKFVPDTAIFQFFWYLRAAALREPLQRS